MTNALTLTTDPTWPWSLSWFGPVGLLLLALLLTGLTVWTYLGVTGATFRRVTVVLALRLGALLLALLAVMRPALAFRDDLHVPSLLLVAADSSESMTIQDEFDGQSRWDALRRSLHRAEPALRRLREEHNVNVVLLRFDSEVRDFDPADDAVKADGKRSDYGRMLHTLLERYRGERYLRGLLVLGDGTDNGTRHPPLPLASQWRNLPCPVHTFAFGKPTTNDRQRDIALTNVTTEPSPVPVKGKLTVRATADAPGFENRPVRVRVLIDDKEVPVLVNDKEEAFQEERLALTAGNELKVVCNAPDRPGEVKVTLKIDPLDDELIKSNNEISTFATVSKEGLSVLYVDRLRAFEFKQTKMALEGDLRIRLHEVIFRNAAEMPEPGQDLYKFGERFYDAIIIGDVTPGQLRSGGPDAEDTIKRLVETKGVGLMMMGGLKAFAAGGWDRSKLADLLPVEMGPPDQVEGRVKVELTEQGRTHFVLRLADSPRDNEELWKGLAPLEGMSRLGELKKNVNGAVLARAREGGATVLAARPYGAGRVVAFAGDTTGRWVRSPRTQQAHARFWRQLVLWLARQEEAEGSAWVKLDARRLAAGGKLGFNVGLRGKGGIDLADARFEAKVVGPNNVETAVPTAREKEEERGTYWKTDEPGEYRVVVKAAGKDSDGQPVSGEASARFLVSQDDTEMARRAADPEFLKRLASTGGGRFHSGDGDELPRFLKELASQPLPQARPKANLWPDWRRGSLSGFLPGFFLLFVALVSLEWFLRRRWGLV
jgi:uncharacterized membrane protein